MGAGNLIADLEGIGVNITTQGDNNRVSRNEIVRNLIGIYAGGGSSIYGMSNTFTQNSISGNALLGIDLPLLGVNPNDAGDGDIGPNGLLNYPEAGVSGSVITGTTCIGCTVELFLADGDASGHGEGESFIAKAVANMVGTFLIDVSPAPIGICRPMTLTATDAAGNTSEFSENLYVGVCLQIPFPWLLGILLAIVGGGGALGGRLGGGRSAAIGAAAGAAAGTGLVIIGMLVPNVILELPQRQPDPGERLPWCEEFLQPESLFPEDGMVFETYANPTFSWAWMEEPSEDVLAVIGLDGPDGLVLSRVTEEDSLSFASFDVMPSPGTRYHWYLIGGRMDESGSFEPICRGGPGRMFQMGALPEVDLSELEPLAPILTPTPEPSPTPTSTPTPTLEPPTITALQNTTCRFGPGSAYEEEGYLLDGESALIHGKNLQETWWWIENPDWQGHCWVWGGSGEITGDTSLVPVIAAPPTPTPEVLVCSENLGQEECEAAGGRWAAVGAGAACICP